MDTALAPSSGTSRTRCRRAVTDRPTSAYEMVFMLSKSRASISMTVLESIRTADKYPDDTIAEPH